MLTKPFNPHFNLRFRLKEDEELDDIGCQSTNIENIMLRIRKELWPEQYKYDEEILFSDTEDDESEDEYDYYKEHEILIADWKMKMETKVYYICLSRVGESPTQIISENRKKKLNPLMTQTMILAGKVIAFFVINV